MIKFKEYNQGQMQLLPPSLDELIEEDHMAGLINQVVNDLDVDDILNTYSSDGCRAYDPRMLIKVFVYAYTMGLRSSRKIANKLHEDIVFMWLTGGSKPDFRTINNFRKDKLIDVKKIFTQVLDLCFELGMVRVGKVFLDGTKKRADASGNKMQYRKSLKKSKESIRKKVDDILAEVDEIDAEEDKIYGDKTINATGINWDDPDVNKKIKDRIKEINDKAKKEKAKESIQKLRKLDKRKNTLKRHKAKEEVKLKEVDIKFKKMRKDRNSMSSVDKDATIMFMKEKYTAPGYNVQFATEHQVILAYDVNSDRTDYNSLKPMVKEIIKNTDKKPEWLVADAGYGRKTNYRYLKQQKIPHIIPYCMMNKEERERREGIYKLPEKYDTELERHKFRQRLRLKQEETNGLFEKMP